MSHTPPWQTTEQCISLHISSVLNYCSDAEAQLRCCFHMFPWQDQLIVNVLSADKLPQRNWVASPREKRHQMPYNCCFRIPAFTGIPKPLPFRNLLDAKSKLGSDAKW